MKINILTQPLFTNYGGILQNYALQTVLRRMGHEPLTVNMPARKPGKKVVWKDVLKTLINLAQKLRGEYNAPFLSPYRWSCKEHELSFPQREFIARYINKVDCMPPFTERVTEQYPAEAWIVGSDQVWRSWCSPYLENCFLDFVGDDCRKIAYAASFGIDEWDISPEMTSRLKSLAHRLDAISVRESNGIELCRKHLGVLAQHLLDPTMLLTADDYLSLTAETDHPKGKYIASYIIDNNRFNANAVKSISKEMELPMQPVGQMHRTRFDSIEQWLSTIAHAECVITDSFHGTVFSTIFHRPVKILTNDVRGNARLDSLLSMLSLRKGNFNFYYPDELTESTINQYRKLSQDFLKTALS